MKSKQNDNENPKELFSEALNNVGLKFAIYAFLAGVVYVAGKFFWWIGVVLFVIFTIYILTELLFSGLLLFISALLALFSKKAYPHSIAKNQFNNVLNISYYSMLTAALYGMFCLFLLTLCGLLFIFFFQEIL